MPFVLTAPPVVITAKARDPVSGFSFLLMITDYAEYLCLNYISMAIVCEVVND